MPNQNPWKYPVVVGVGFRAVINVGSPSHEEAVGEYTEHKKAPIYYEGTLYVDVPIISGNAVRRYVKESLIQVALSKGLPVGELCRKGIFTHWNTSTDLKEDVGLTKLSTSDESISNALKKCVIEDVSGFMYAVGGASITRFSRLHVATVKPTYEALSKSRVYPIQLARHDPRRGKGGGEKSAQMIFRVEHVSGEFAGLMTLETHLLGFNDLKYKYFVKVPDEVIERAEAVVTAMYLGLRRFGAMKARSLTVLGINSLVITVSKGYFTPIDPSMSNYVELTTKEAKGYKELTGWDVKVVTYPPMEGTEGASSIAEAFNKAKEEVVKLLNESLGGK